MNNPKKFVFLFPEKVIFDLEIRNGCRGVYHQWERERGHLFDPFSVKDEKEKQRIQLKALEDLAKYFRPIYTKKLNSCIKYRYRNKGFGVSFVVSPSCPILDIVDIDSEDQIVYSRSNGEITPPNNKYILEQLQPLEILRIGGFHMWDCVEKFARTAYEAGIDTMVDEDLTEFFDFRIFERDFKVKSYHGLGKPKLIPEFMQARENKPWLWQNYSWATSLKK